ncbi:hypothetical protein [Roseococcus sp. YIM B11640]|uniref:hypothetical protein n=1 Tax=Roseococcus sp. YIM B11640 TaxID=3133973 RepID=UPI003C7A5AF6
MMPRSAALLAALFLAGCAAEPARNANLPAIGVAFQWTAADGCSQRSPALSIQGLPPGTARVTVRMTDLDLPSSTHGGGDVFVPPTGQIAAGTLPGYAGPCPPTGEIHSYRITVDALDASNRVIGTGQATRRFPPT